MSDSKADEGIDITDLDTEKMFQKLLTTADATSETHPQVTGIFNAALNQLANMPTTASEKREIIMLTAMLKLSVIASARNERRIEQLRDQVVSLAQLTLSYQLDQIIKDSGAPPEIAEAIKSVMSHGRGEIKRKKG